MHKLRLIAGTDLPNVAREALSDGYDSRSLRILAVSDNDPDVDRLFDDALAEAGFAPLSPREAALAYARSICERILLGEIRPYDGAKAIWRVSLDVGGTLVPELDPFIYAASESEDRPEDCEFFDEEIKKQALQLVA
ncbi:MAG TPA: hypothetical protein VF824_16830 [Thermoanaerobaculia bacterium]|jgi:hypothetical protein